MGAKETKNDKKGSGKNIVSSTTASKEQDVDALATRLDKTHLTEKPASPLEKVAHLIKTKQATKILVLSGAGVSCSAGIPDFRSPGTGLYDNLQKYNLPYPEAVFDLGFYRHNPKPFLNLAKALWPGVQHSPTLTHSFISLLHKKNVLLRNYSQNIDGLEFLADLPNDQLVECHGHFRTASCIDCGKPSNDAEETILYTDNVPTCSSCGGKVKPDIVFFGEGLPAIFHKLLPRDVDNADLLLIMGTSLQVAPVSLIPDMVSCPRVLLNRERVGNLHEARGDVVVKGDCDDAVLQLSELLGWKEELVALNEKTRIVQSEDSVKGEENGSGKEEGKVKVETKVASGEGKQEKK